MQPIPKKAAIEVPSREPENTAAAIIAKGHAENQLALIEKTAELLRQRRKAWRKRRAQCMAAIVKYARR